MRPWPRQTRRGRVDGAFLLRTTRLLRAALAHTQGGVRCCPFTRVDPAKADAYGGLWVGGWGGGGRSPDGTPPDRLITAQPSTPPPPAWGCRWIALPREALQWPYTEGGGGVDYYCWAPLTHKRHIPPHPQHSPGTPTTGLRERGNDTSRSTGRSGRQNAATRCNMRREERVTVQGPVKEQQPDGMSHGGWIPRPPDQRDHRGKERNLPLRKSGRAIFGTLNSESQTPPPPAPPWPCRTARPTVTQVPGQR